MSQKSKALQGVFITGTGTDVGKSLVTAALSRALWQESIAHKPIKPVQTGVVSAEDADATRYGAAHVGLPVPTQYAGRTLFSFTMPASPHLAAAQEERTLCAQDIFSSLYAVDAQTPVLLEGAGGVYVPLNAQESMLDVMQQLALPVLVVMRNTLGALNHTLLTLEVLHQRGLRVAALICKETDIPESLYEQTIRADNVAYLQEYLANTETLLFEMPYIAQLTESAWDSLAECMRPVAKILAQEWTCAAQVDNKSDIIAWDETHLWHPYTSAVQPLPVYEVVRAQGTRLYLRDGTALIDGMSSWWCAVHGYGQKKLVEAAQKQVTELSHVMFGGITHTPAVHAAQKLMALLPKTTSLSRLFWADSGSVAVEVALKMALQYQQGIGQVQRTKVLSPYGGYYGDTLGAMSVCDPINGMHTLFSHVLPQHIFIERPTCAFDGTTQCPFDTRSLDALEDAFIEHGAELAAFIVEPIVQGAGGMYFYHPRYLHKVRELCNAYGVVLILDEIATGFGRTGKMFAHEWCAEWGESISPDILCVGKALTGGMMTLAATLCSETVAQGICSEGHVFMHGPTFMGNPLACAVAAASLDMLVESDWYGKIQLIEKALKLGLMSCADHEDVRDVRVLGAIGVVEMRHAVNMGQLQKFFVEQGVWIRPFGRLIYIMPPFVSSAEDISTLCAAVCAAIKQKYIMEI